MIHVIVKVHLSQKIMEDFYFSKKIYSKSLSWAESLNFPPSDLEYFFGEEKILLNLT